MANIFWKTNSNFRYPMFTWNYLDRGENERKRTWNILNSQMWMKVKVISSLLSLSVSCVVCVCCMQINKHMCVYHTLPFMLRYKQRGHQVDNLYNLSKFQSQDKILFWSRNGFAGAYNWCIYCFVLFLTSTCTL